MKRPPLNLPVDRFRHVALFYSGEGQYLRETLSFIHEGLQAGEPVLVVETQHKQALLQAALGAYAKSVEFAEMELIGANPAHIIPAWQDFVTRCSSAGGAVRGIGEPIWAGRYPDELADCQWHESLLNVAFGSGRPWTLLCPYDTEHLDAALVEEARRSHEWVIEDGSMQASSEYRGMELSGAALSAPLRPSPDTAAGLVFDRRNLGAVRALVSRHATDAGLNRARVAELVIAANEVATNSVHHGGGRGTLRVWTADGRVVCEIRDQGLFDRPLVDRQTPGEDPSASRGLWLANQLCDLVQIRTFGDGTVVRLHRAVQPRRGLRVLPNRHTAVG